MNINEEQIEKTLRAAPTPKPPADLKERLISRIQLPDRDAPGVNGNTLRTPGGLGGWVRRWWLVLAPAAASLACAVEIGAQRTEIADLKQNVPQPAPQVSLTSQNGDAAPAVASVEPTPDAGAAAKVEDEVARLRQKVSELSSDISRLEAMRTENERLRIQLAAPSGQTLTADEMDAMMKAKEKAEAIACVNNMKQLGLAGRIWANDNSDKYPMDLLDMTNEMSTPKILVCPGDHDRQSATNFSSYTPANCSYEYLAPGSSDSDPERVMFRCPIHGTICLCDGSVQMKVGRNHPEQLVERDGKLYYDPSIQPASNPSATPQSNDSQP